MKKAPVTSAKTLAEVLKKRRKELKITQKELAAFCNLSHNGISRIEVRRLGCEALDNLKNVQAAWL